MKRIAFFISIITAIFFTSCEKVGKVCNVSDPLTELSWLAQMKEVEDISISKAIFKDKESNKRVEGFIFTTNASTPSPGSFTTFFNCSGEGLCSIGCFTLCDDYEVIKDEEIYKR